jgi:hypothetical protein
MTVVGLAAWFVAPLQPTLSVTSVEPIEVDPASARIVILVDVFGSMSAQDIAQERQTASSIALGAISPHSAVSVVGFSFGQAAATVLCPMTTVTDSSDRETLSSCIPRANTQIRRNRLRCCVGSGPQ